MTPDYARRCVCGHDQCMHGSSRPMNVLSPVRYGVCLKLDCGCKQYSYAAADQRKQAS